MNRLKIYILLTIVFVLSGILLLSKYSPVTSVKACGESGCHCDTRTTEVWQHQDWVEATYKCPSNDSAYTYTSRGDRTCSREVNSGKCSTTKWAYKVVNVAGHWGEIQNGRCPEHRNGDECKETKVSGGTQYRFNDSGDWKDGTCPAPVDGQVLEWSTCSVNCGGGTQMAIRVSDPQYCGKPVNIRTRACNTQSCETSPSPTPEVTPVVTPEVTPTPTTVEEIPAPQPCNGCGGQPQAPSCGATKPSTPDLLGVVRHGTTADLSWTASVPVSYYSIVYGTQPDNFIYGAANIGNTTHYTVNGLNLGTTYYFSVRGVNDCMPSDPSATSPGQVLGASTGGQVLGLAFTGNSSLLYLLLSAGCVSLILSYISFRFAKSKA